MSYLNSILIQLNMLFIQYYILFNNLDATHWLPDDYLFQSLCKEGVNS